MDLSWVLGRLGGGDASGREYPRAEQNRQRPIDIFELHDGPGYTVVAGGPVGLCETPSPNSEESQDPLEHVVLIHADPAGQLAAVGTMSPSDCYPAGMCVMMIIYKFWNRSSSWF